MPRPGARPYECVRRAWHSDRHQPMRGSLIQEIFRVVNEIHSSATRKNKEWQEKLPVVVLKAEEIMYSKANSEAEYIDLKTLWERANDAVNTIIRRDESMETGEFLQPCIEAALNLGCTPRRASRSQRHSNPRFYLSSGAQDNTVTSDAPKVVTNSMTREGSSSSLLPLQSVNLNSSPQFATFYSTSLTPKTINSTRLGSESNTTGAQVANKPKPHELTYSLPMACHMFPLSSEKDKSSLPMQTYSSSSLGCIYPLYYGTQLHQPLESQLTFQTPLDSNGNTVILGTPIAEAKTGFLKNLLGRNDGLEATVRSTLGNLDPPDAEFDLSLHLGPSSIPRSTSENCSAVEVEDVGLNNSHDGSKLWDLPPSKLRSSNFDFSPSFPDRDQGFCFFRTDAIDNPLESCSSKRSLEGEGLNVETPIKKRKAPIDDTVNNRQFWWQPNISSNQFFNSSKEPNL